jgi:hypothetical protein
MMQPPMDADDHDTKLIGDFYTYLTGVLQPGDRTIGVCWQVVVGLSGLNYHMRCFHRGSMMQRM